MHEMSETDEEHKLSRLTVILSNTIVHFDKVRMMSRGPWSGLIGHLIDRGHRRNVTSKCIMFLQTVSASRGTRRR